MDPRVSTVIYLLSEDLRRDLTPHIAAASVNLSVSRFRHLFKTETGVSVVKYLNTLRLERAKELLGATTLSIKQVMAEVGMKDKSNFARDFKKRYGLSPAQYRSDFQQHNGPAILARAVFTNK